MKNVNTNIQIARGVNIYTCQIILSVNAVPVKDSPVFGRKTNEAFTDTIYTNDKGLAVLSWQGDEILVQISTIFGAFNGTWKSYNTYFINHKTRTDSLLLQAGTKGLFQDDAITLPTVSNP